MLVIMFLGTAHLTPPVYDYGADFFLLVYSEPM